MMDAKLEFLRKAQNSRWRLTWPLVKCKLLYIPRGPSDKTRNRRAVKGWPPEIISIYILNQDLGGQPCQFFAGNFFLPKI